MKKALKTTGEAVMFIIKLFSWSFWIGIGLMAGIDVYLKWASYLEVLVK